MSIKQIDTELFQRKHEISYLNELRFFENLSIFQKIPLGFLILMIVNLHYENKLKPLQGTIQGETLQKLFEMHSTHIFSSKKMNDASLSEDEQMVIRLVSEYGSIWNISSVETKKVGPYGVEYNPLRALRPKREAKTNSHADATPIYLPFDDSKFNFSGDVLDREFYCDFSGIGSLGFNKFPFVRGQTVLVPFRKFGKIPQFLTGALLEAKTAFHQQVPYTRIAWNSLGAFASVNHAHFQVTDEELPIESVKIEKSQMNWPTFVKIFEGESIERDKKLLNYISTYIHDSEGEFIGEPTYYNILFTHERTYLFLRKNQNQIVPAFGTGFAWVEMAGKFILIDKAEYDAISEKQISDALQLISIPK